MRTRRQWAVRALGLLAGCGLVIGLMTWSPTAAQRSPLRGGAHGLVRSASGVLLEGIGVQLIADKTAMRTTVYTNNEGSYEFPPLDAGTYTLRVALPREYQPWAKQAVQIQGATQFGEITLERVSKSDLLPPEPEILSQLTGAEWMMNIPGTGEEKRVLTLSCGFGCHSYQQIFRNRHDENGWRLILQRMMRGAGSPIINLNQSPATSRNRFYTDRPLIGDEELLAKWLSRVRGPESKDEPVSYLARPSGAATRVVITEYELPRELLAPHDVHADSTGKIWYTAHRSPYGGVLDPRNGQITEYRIPGKADDTPNALPGTHRVWVDKNDIVWFSEQWDHYLTALDAKTGKIVKRFKAPGSDNLTMNSAGFGNFAMDAAGYLYISRGGTGVVKMDTNTGQVVQSWPFKKIRGTTYDSIVTPDGRYWSGAPVGGNIVALLDTKTGEMSEIETGTEISSGSRGGFDPEGNVWFGGRGGMLIKVDAKTHRASTYPSPYQYDSFYEAMPDKNGEIWAGGLQSGHFLRFNPKTEKWISYMLPEPYAHDRRTWIDNSTTPVTVWYVDHDGYMVRLQPLQ